MIEDLLEYNSISAGAFKIQLEPENMNQFIQEISHRWKVTQEEKKFELHVDVPEQFL